MFTPRRWPHPWTTPPQIKDLPRDSHIDINCRSCKRLWRESVRDMVEKQRLGAQYLDLLEWQSRCKDDTCRGMVCFIVEDDDVLQAA